MKPAILTKLETLEQRLAELNGLLSSEQATRDLNEYRKLNREHSELSEVVSHFQTWKRAIGDRDEAAQMRAEPDMREFADDEHRAAIERAQVEERKLELLLLPKDPNDERNVMLEIRAGTGGDESALFAGEMLRMYLRFAERQRWQTEVMSANESELGGYREVIVRISGDAVYSKLKFESGGHRVQRVPETEAQGRIHTSACTVAVMAEADEAGEINIESEDLRIDVFRASGAGGQHVNKTESAVRITHLPTGIVVECQDDRSQHRNKDKAMKVLMTRLKDKQQQEAHAKESAHRKSLVGTGDRSERIRTYNFPQGRVTEHRINLTLYKIAQIMDGDLNELIEPLGMAHAAEQLEALAGEA